LIKNQWKNKSYYIENKIFHFLKTHDIYLLLSRTFFWLNSLERSFILAFIIFLVHMLSIEHLATGSFLFFELWRRLNSFRFLIFLILYRVKLFVISCLLRRIDWHENFIAKIFGIFYFNWWIGNYFFLSWLL